MWAPDPGRCQRLSAGRSVAGRRQPRRSVHDYAVRSGVRRESCPKAKEAGPSALADYAGKSEYNNDGERVVAGQHLMQASSDIFLGWLRTGRPGGQHKDYYLRQLRDWKLSAVVEEMILRA
jgi:hypothetical protein